MNRAYSLLEIKAADDGGDERVIRGVATTPSPDRVGDIVEPMGVQFKNPLPLLWQHRADSPVGTVRFDKPTKGGITFTARLPKNVEPGALKDRIDEAWQSVKAGLVRAVSIGFRALEYSIMDDGGGLRFLESEVLELSLVTIPANADATISTIKSIDAEVLAASGRKDFADTASETTPPAAAGRRKSVKLGQEGKPMTKTLAEQITALESERSTKNARMNEIAEKAIGEGRTTEEDEREELDGLEAEIEALDVDIKRYKRMQARNAAAAKPVEGVRSIDAGTAARNDESRSPVRIKRHEDLKPGVAFARYAKVKALAHLEHMPSAEIAKSLYGEDSAVFGVLQKASISAGAHQSGNWAEDLVGDETSVFADFVEYLRPMTIIGRFGTNGVPSLRSVPFRVPLISQTGGGAGYWVGEGKAKPLTAFDFSRTTLDELKVANIAVVTEELLRKSSPSADAILRDQLAAALRDRMDADFIDPTNSGSSGIKPASIVNGTSAVGNASGTTADDVRADLASLISAYANADNPLESGVLIMRQSVAIQISMMRNALGQQEFPALGRNGGTIEGFPVLTTNHIGTDSAGSYIVMVNAGDVYLGDEGGVMVDMSREASLEMADTTTGTSVTPTASSLVSLWQTNSVGFRAERIINWKRRRTEAVQWIDAVAYAA